MRATLGTVASGFIEPPATFALDATAHGTALDAGRADLAWSHVPNGLPIGCLVLIGCENTSTDTVSAATYGGVALTGVTLSPFNGLLGSEENCMLHGFWKSGGLPTGTQTVQLTNEDTSTAIHAASFTFVGPNGIAVEDTSTADTSGANPTVALTIANDSVCAGVCYSGQDTNAGITVGAGMTQVQEVDTGGQVISLAYKTAIQSTNTTLDWTATAEDYAILAVAIKST